MAIRKTSVGKGVAAVDRALSIVTVLETAGQAVSLAELSRQTGYYKSTILRLITSLQSFSLVIMRPDKRYSLGPLAFRLGRSFESNYHLREHVLPVLERLVAQGAESPSFHIRHDCNQRICLFRIDSKHSTLDSVHAGDLLPIDRGAPGTVIRQYEQPLGKVAVSSMDVAIASVGERDPACASVAAPVFGADGEFYGALSLSGPRERFTKSSVRQMSPLLISACRAITTSLGGTWPWLLKAGRHAKR